jgi:hypothetical protein
MVDMLMIIKGLVIAVEGMAGMALRHHHGAQIG